MKLNFAISTFNVHTYYFARSEKLLHENKQKTLRTTNNLFNNGENQSQVVRKTVFFLMRSCSIQRLVLHWDNDHIQKSTSCDFRLSTWRW